VAAGQSVGARQPTQSPLARSQIGWSASWQSVFARQLAWQRRSPPHVEPTGQLALMRHCTHSPVDTSQTGAAAPQFAFVAHCEQRACVGSQTGVAPLQSALLAQPMHA
jgi:hypothetical protein